MKKIVQSILISLVIVSFVSGCIVVKHEKKKEKVVVVPEKKKHKKKHKKGKEHKKVKVHKKGKKHKKGRERITICHKGKTKIIKRSALKGHLKHGDTTGPCQ